MKFKNYDRNKHDKRKHNIMVNEMRIERTIKKYQQEIKEMKLEMEMR